MLLRDILFSFGVAHWASDAEGITRNRMIEMTWVFGLKIEKKLKAAKIETNWLRMIAIIPIDQRTPLPPTRRGDNLVLDVPLDWDQFRAKEADDDAFRDLICVAALRALGQIGPEWGLPVAQLCDFVNEIAAEPYVLEWTEASRRVPGSKMKIRLGARLEARAFRLFLVAENGGEEIRREEILTTRTNPQFWHHQFKSLRVDKETITVNRRSGADRPLFTCRVPQVTSGAA